MIQHIWSTVCKDSMIEASTNNISLIDLYEELQFDLSVDEKTYNKDLPIVGPFDFQVVSLFYRDKKGTQEEFEVTIKLLDPKSTVLGEYASKTELKEEHNRVRNRVKFNTIALTTSGTYVVQVHVKEGGKQHQMAAIPLDIKVKVNGKDL